MSYHTSELQAGSNIVIEHSARGCRISAVRQESPFYRGLLAVHPVPGDDPRHPPAAVSVVNGFLEESEQLDHPAGTVVVDRIRAFKPDDDDDRGVDLVRETYLVTVPAKKGLPISRRNTRLLLRLSLNHGSGGEPENRFVDTEGNRIHATVEFLTGTDRPDPGSNQALIPLATIEYDETTGAITICQHNHGEPRVLIEALGYTEFPSSSQESDFSLSDTLHSDDPSPDDSGSVSENSDDGSASPDGSFSSESLSCSSSFSDPTGSESPGSDSSDPDDNSDDGSSTSDQFPSSSDAQPPEPPGEESDSGSSSDSVPAEPIPGRYYIICRTQHNGVWGCDGGISIYHELLIECAPFDFELGCTDAPHFTDTGDPNPPTSNHYELLAGPFETGSEANDYYNANLEILTAACPEEEW